MDRISRPCPYAKQRLILGLQYCTGHCPSTRKCQSEFEIMWGDASREKSVTNRTHHNSEWRREVPIILNIGMLKWGLFVAICRKSACLDEVRTDQKDNPDCSHQSRCGGNPVLYCSWLKFRRSWLNCLSSTVDTTYLLPLFSLPSVPLGPSCQWDDNKRWPPCWCSYLQSLRRPSRKSSTFVQVRSNHGMPPNWMDVLFCG